VKSLIRVLAELKITPNEQSPLGYPLTLSCLQRESSRTSCLDFLFCKKSIVVILLLLLIGCGSKKPPNLWQYHAVLAFENYTKATLSNQTLIAKDALKQAKKEATQSADFDTLARVELGVCALDVALLQYTSCETYLALKHHHYSANLDAYYHLIQGKITSNEISLLPQHYQPFATAYLSHHTNEVFQIALKLQPISSSVVALGILSPQLNQDQINQVISHASYYGLKAVVIAWIALAIVKSDSPKHKAHLQQKLKFMQEI